jgi:hypothetical protein
MRLGGMINPKEHCLIHEYIETMEDTSPIDRPSLLQIPLKNRSPEAQFSA